MAIVHLPEYLWAGTTADPRELQLDIFELAREVNGFVDRDNVGELQITTAKVAAGTYNTVGSTEYENTTETLDAGETGAWKEISSLSTTVTTDDGRLHVEVWGNYEGLGAGTKYQGVVEFRLLINGEVIDETGWMSIIWEADTFFLQGSRPVDAGTAAVTVQWRGYGKPWTDLDDLAEGNAPATADQRNYLTIAQTLTRAVLLWRHQKR